MEIFHRPLNVSIDLAENIVKATTVLHNFVHIRDGHEDTLSIQRLYDEVLQIPSKFLKISD
nr:unnamed protein product [Callosobruchus analis]